MRGVKCKGRDYTRFALGFVGDVGGSLKMI